MGSLRPFSGLQLSSHTSLCGPFQGPAQHLYELTSGPFRGPTLVTLWPITRQLIVTIDRTAYFDQWQTTYKPSWPNKKRLHRPVKSVSTHTAGYHSCTTGGRAINIVICWSAVVVNRTQPYGIPHHILSNEAVETPTYWPVPNITS